MENLEVILSLAGTCLGLAIAVATAVAKYARSAKAKKIAEQTLDICNAVLPYVEQAETYVRSGGAEKKAFVLTKVNQYAIENGLEFDSEAVSAKIEELIAFSRTVNARETAAVSSENDESRTDGA